jgi:porin
MVASVTWVLCGFGASTRWAARSRPAIGRSRAAAARLMLSVAVTLAMPGMLGGALAQTAPQAPSLWQQNTLTGDWDGLRTRLVNDGFTFALQQQSEVWANALGGLSRGGAANGLLTLSLAVDLDKAVGWKGGNLFVSGFQVEGVGPSPLRVGALQLVSSIEATQSTKL